MNRRGCLDIKCLRFRPCVPCSIYCVVLVTPVSCVCLCDYVCVCVCACVRVRERAIGHSASLFLWGALAL